MIDLSRRIELEKAAAKQLDDALAQGKWFILVLSEKDGKVTLKEASCDFPFAAFPTCRRLIDRAIELKEGEGVPAPLPLADHILPHATQFMDQTPTSPEVVGGTPGPYFGPTD